MAEPRREPRVGLEATPADSTRLAESARPQADPGSEASPTPVQVAVSASGFHRERARSGPGLSPGPAIRLEEAAVRLGGRTIWSNVTLDVAPGEFVAVLGPNGVGKSTLIKAILGVLPLASGRASVLGRPPGMAAKGIGYLPQRRSFDTNLRVRGRDIVRLGSDGDRWGLPFPAGDRLFASRRRERRRIDDVIELVGATAYADRPIGQVSGGEQQRLLIAQALVRNPEILLLDEPLDSLDLPTQAGVVRLISEISRTQDIAVVIVAHDVNPIIPYLDGVVYVASGGAVSGRPEQVINSETLSSLYEAPIEVLRTSDGRMVVVGQPDPPAHHADRHAGKSQWPGG
ncbi:MAG: metal ABC transporter ATP-binding protein [Acidimicrobiales bacterium]